MAVNAGMFEAFRVARNSLVIATCSMLMILIFCGAEEDRVRNVKATIFCFEAMSGLKVNFKSEVIGLRIEKLLLLECSKILGCKIGIFQFCTWHAAVLGAGY